VVVYVSLYAVAAVVVLRFTDSVTPLDTEYDIADEDVQVVFIGKL